LVHDAYPTRLFGSKQQPADLKQDEEAIQPAPSDEEQPPVNTIKIPLGKLKNLFGSKQQPEEAKQEEAQSAPHEVEQASMSPAKGQFGKLKNLFGKTK